MGGGDDDIDARSANMQSIYCHRFAIAALRVGMLVDNDTDATWQRDGEVGVRYEDGLARCHQADEYGIPGDGGLSIAAGGAGVRFHDIGSNQTTQQVHALDRGLRLTAGPTARSGAA